MQTPVEREAYRAALGWQGRFGGDDCR